MSTRNATQKSSIKTAILSYSIEEPFLLPLMMTNTVHLDKVFTYELLALDDGTTLVVCVNFNSGSIKTGESQNLTRVKAIFVPVPYNSLLH
jgi:hypothetical protein